MAVQAYLSHHCSPNFSANFDKETAPIRSLKIDISGPKLRVCNRKIICYFSTKTYVVGTQKNHLNETVLLSTQNTC